jgi:hypothetical protein
MKLRIFIIALMMEAVRISETSVDIQLRTWQYIPKDSELYLSLYNLPPHDAHLQEK